jgi:hypothetical protein
MNELCSRDENMVEIMQNETVRFVEERWTAAMRQESRFGIRRNFLGCGGVCETRSVRL